MLCAKDRNFSIYKCQYMNNNNNSRVALVTGSTSGIGLAIANNLASEGFIIALHSKKSIDAGVKLTKKYKGSSYTQADLNNQEEVHNLITQVIEKHGRIDVLVNNAGGSTAIPHSQLKEATPEIWREQYEVNVIAPWILISEAEGALKDSSSLERPSVILNISTHASIRPKGASIPYAASKAALNHMTKLLALTLAPNIRVNAIAPGLVDTPLSEKWDAARTLWNESSPMKREARPDEIAQIASSFIGNNYLTGEIIIIDGGLNLT